MAQNHVFLGQQHKNLSKKPEVLLKETGTLLAVSCSLSFCPSDKPYWAVRVSKSIKEWRKQEDQIRRAHRQEVELSRWKIKEMSISKQGTISKPLHSTLRPSSKTQTTPLFIGTYIYRLKIYFCFICWFSSFKFDMGSKCHFDWLATQFTWLIHLGSYWIWILLIISVWTCFVMNLISRNLKLCASFMLKNRWTFSVVHFVYVCPFERSQEIVGIFIS